jgi:hypothetical protein
MELTVLFVRDCGGCLLSAQMVFNEDHTLRSLDCAHTYASAAQFLVDHPDSLIFCEEDPSERGCSNPLSRLILGGSPAALIAIHAASTGTVSVEVHVYKGGEILREVVIGGDVIKAINIAWQYCNEMSPELHPASPKLETLQIM